MALESSDIYQPVFNIYDHLEMLNGKCAGIISDMVKYSVVLIYFISGTIRSIIYKPSRLRYLNNNIEGYYKYYRHPVPSRRLKSF